MSEILTPEDALDEAVRLAGGSETLRKAIQRYGLALLATEPCSKHVWSESSQCYVQSDCKNWETSTACRPCKARAEQERETGDGASEP